MVDQGSAGEGGQKGNGGESALQKSTFKKRGLVFDSRKTSENALKPLHIHS